MRFHRIRLPILALLAFLGFSHSPSTWAEEAGSGRAALPSGAPSMSMEQWREANEFVNAAMEGPPGDEKIATLEKFLKEHPTYPELHYVLQNLVSAYIEKRDFDPAHLASLIERVADTKSLYGFTTEEFLVSSYYFKYHLPMESAERLLARARSEIAAQKLSMAQETLPRKREQTRLRIESREFMLALCEGRILLEKKDYPAALDKLRQAEQLGDLNGRSALLLEDSTEKAIRRIPTVGIDWLYLSLATAFLKTGNRHEARAHLEQVQDILPNDFPEIGIAKEALRKELGMPRPSAGRETRAEPKPAADFRLKDLDGNEVALSDFHDRVVLAMLWATW
jgi:tetratricopeptide (TPR) repeat protein